MKKIPVRTINEPELFESFSIRDIGGMLSEKGMFQELHRHSFFFVLALEEGSGEHAIDFTSYPVNDHSVFFLRPGQVHQLMLEKGSAGYLLIFNADFYSPFGGSTNEVLRKVSSRNHYQFQPDKFEKVHAVLSDIFLEYVEKQEKYMDVIKADLDIFFIELLRYGQSHGGTAIGGSIYAQERLEVLLELIETHITSCKQVKRYADMLHLTTYQLNAITKETLGKNCSQLINEQIILEAKRNLLATTNQVNEIAGLLGYVDTSYFIRFFKKQTGFSPEVYRQNFK
ncbi:helix-turn-helix domain-containing protein [Fulvivirga sp. 29W222]|uniref:Helix-turn-helix domain-containing protein n=1 Tax=Fulvivirga marina TaxID=2494733 RepID=A0A937FTC5_9BACT|nr:AraC family transcriptional regulator [Fulvivirga marina]MBL6445304.1 helix-turn-helix domain-containing protein [Fulvivirga marina]